MYRTIFNAEEKLWCGVTQPSVYNPKISLGHVLLRAMKSSPTKIAQISANNNVRVKYDELYTKSVRAAQNIQKLNYKKGDIFAVISGNNHELSPIVMALLSTGHAFNTLDPAFKEAEITYMLGITKPKLIFSDLESYETVQHSLQKLNNDAEIFTFCGQIGDSRAVDGLFAETGRESEFIPVDINAEKEIAMIPCSSGTTGLIKGVCLTHAAILDQMTRGFDVTSDTVLFSFSTLYWLSGIMIFVIGILNSATRIITTEAFSPELLLRLIEEYKINFVMSASHQLTLCAKNGDLQHRDLSSVTAWFAGGSHVPVHSCVSMNKFLPNGAVNIGYGMTELAGLIATNISYRRPEAVGEILNGVQIKIVDKSGNRLGIRESGEVCVKTKYEFGGYYGNQERTDALFDMNGFIQTGDIGHFDEEGFLYITDRKKDFLKYRSNMISPSEIENALIACPEIASVCVVGISDTLSGDLPAAVIVRNTNSNSSITEREIHEMIATKFTDAKKLRGGVYFVDSLPTTMSGKVLRRDVKKFATELYMVTSSLEYSKPKTPAPFNKNFIAISG